MKVKVIVAKNQKHFSDAFRIRTNVFIGEQHVPAHEEIDNLDAFVPILVAYEGEKALGTARSIEMKEGYVKIGRVAVLKEARRMGVGRALMLAAIDYIKQETKLKQVKLEAQLSAQGFYETLGFESYGEIFVDAGIDHISMKKNI